MQWKLSFLIGAPVVVLLTIVAVVVIVLFVRARYADLSAKVMATLFALLIWGVIAVPTFFLTCFPVNAEYLQWRPVSGEVTQIASRQVADGKGMSQRYVVILDGGHQAYAIDDTRAATLSKGDHVDLMCTREWQWASTPGYACRWNQ